MLDFARLCDQIAATTKKNEKKSLLAGYFAAKSNAGLLNEAACAAVFLSGRAFPLHEETILNVGGALLSRVVEEISGAPKAAMSAAYRRYGDFGSATQDLLAAHKPEPPRLTTVEVETVF